MDFPLLLLPPAPEEDVDGPASPLPPKQSGSAPALFSSPAKDDEEAAAEDESPEMNSFRLSLRISSNTLDWVEPMRSDTLTQFRRMQ